MKQKRIQIVLIIFLITVTAGWQLYNRKKNSLQINRETIAYLPVEVKIESVFPSGRGFRRSTLLTVSYTYKDNKFRKTIRKEGYLEGRYKQGSVLTFYLDPENPEDLIDRTLSDF
jgi:hypothetical protein